MDRPWEKALVVIGSSHVGNQRYGTGFVIHKDQKKTYLLTCMHVVRDVGGEDAVKIDKYQAKVFATSPEEKADLALLYIDAVLDKPALQLSIGGEKEHPISIAGYHLNSKQYLVRPLKGTLKERVGIAATGQNDLIKAWDLVITDAYPLQDGYSGSPVFDEYNHVIGVVITRQGDGKMGVAIGIEALISIWEDMPPDFFAPHLEEYAGPSPHASLPMKIWDLERHAVKNIDDALLSENVREIALHQQRIREEMRQVALQRQQAKAQKNLALQRKLFDEERDLQNELALYHRQMQLLLAHEQRKVLLLQEGQEMLKNWPLRVFPSQILSQEHKPAPLKILISPPEIAYDQFQQHEVINKSLNDDLRLGLRTFLEAQYPSSSLQRPAELLDGAWDSKRYYGGAAIRALYTWLKSEPMLILEMLANVSTFSLHVAYWGHGSQQANPWYRTIGRFPLLSNVVVPVACFFAAWFLDVHHLVYAENPEQASPLLPKLVQDLLVDPQMQVVFSPHLGLWMRRYRDVLEALKTEQSHSIPLLALQLAESLSVLPEKMLAHEYLAYSLETWLELRNIAVNKESELLNSAINTFDILDQEYIHRLGKCLDNMGERQGLQVLAIEDVLRQQLLDRKLKRDRYGVTLYGSY